MQANSPEARNAVHARGHLLRVLGMAFAVAVGIGSTIGAGILHTPGDIAALLPVPLFIMALWVFGALNSLLGATVYAELGAMMPSAGGPYVFARRAFGGYAGFFVGYASWVQYCASDAALALLVGEYLPVLVPSLAGHTAVIALICLIVLVALQWRGVRWGSRVQTITSAAKVIALLGLVIAAFALPHTTVAITAPGPVAPHGAALALALVLAMQGIIFTYMGFTDVVYFGEELRDPGRDIPRALFRGLYVIIGVYLLLNLAFLWVLPMAAMANEPFVGGAVARALFGGHGDVIITAIVIISMLGSINVGILETARMLLAMARDGLSLRGASAINAGGTPTVATLLSTAITVAFVAAGSFDAVMAVVTLLTVAIYLLMFAALIVLRLREPAAPRPYRAWGYPWTTVVAILIALVFMVGVLYGDPLHSAVALGLLLVSYPLYRVIVRFGSAELKKAKLG